MKPSRHCAIWLSITVAFSLLGFVLGYPDSDWLSAKSKIGMASEVTFIFGGLGILIATSIVVGLLFKDVLLRRKWTTGRLVLWCSSGGAFAGAALTTTVQAIMVFCDTADTTIGWLMMLPVMLTWTPAFCVAKFLSWHVRQERYIAPWDFFLLMLLCNSALLALAGAALAWTATGLRSAALGRKHGET